MLKISFVLKKQNTDQASVTYLAISAPEKIKAGPLAGAYACHVDLPLLEGSKPIYADNPIDAIRNASTFAQLYLKGLTDDRGYTIE